MIRKSKIIYCSVSKSSFINNDLEGLSEFYTVKYLQHNWINKKRIPISFIFQFFSILVKIKNTKSIVVSFVGYHSFWPVIFGKIFKIPVFLILNGTDSVGIKSLNYGLHLKKIPRWFCRFSLKNSTEAWPVSSFLIEGESSFTGLKISYGVKVSFPNIKVRYFVIPNGFYSDFWVSLSQEKRRENSITSVISSKNQFNLKGVDLLLEFAKIQPDYFVNIIGMDNDINCELPNVRFHGKLNQEALKVIFEKSLYYFQLSSFEGFGCSLCEAMLMGCIPVGSNVNAIPQIIGNSGFILEEKNIDLLSQLMKRISSMDLIDKDNLSNLAKKTIVENFSMKNRISLMIERINLYN